MSRPRQDGERGCPPARRPSLGRSRIHSHSTANRAQRAGQVRQAVAAVRRPARTSRRSGSTANQPTLVDLPSPRTAIPAVATAAYGSSGARR